MSALTRNGSRAFARTPDNRPCPSGGYRQFRSGCRSGQSDELNPCTVDCEPFHNRSVGLMLPEMSTFSLRCFSFAACRGRKVAQLVQIICSPPSHAATNPASADASEFADDNHWATGAQSVLGSYFYCLAKNSWTSLNWPTSNTMLPFDCSKFPLIK
jgi:hypothetical protein